jgi:hypothetical protein
MPARPRIARPAETRPDRDTTPPAGVALEAASVGLHESGPSRTFRPNNVRLILGGWDPGTTPAVYPLPRHHPLKLTGRRQTYQKNGIRRGDAPVQAYFPEGRFGFASPPEDETGTAVWERTVSGKSFIGGVGVIGDDAVHFRDFGERGGQLMNRGAAVDVDDDVDHRRSTVAS